MNFFAFASVLRLFEPSDSNQLITNDEELHAHLRAKRQVTTITTTVAPSVAVATCCTLPTISNGQAVCDGTGVGGTWHIQCYSNYHLAGVAATNCTTATTSVYAPGQCVADPYDLLPVFICICVFLALTILVLLITLLLCCLCKGKRGAKNGKNNHGDHNSYQQLDKGT